MSPPPGMTFDPDDDPLDAMAEGRERRLVPVHPPQTIDNETGKPVDPRSMINAAALVQRLQQFALGAQGVVMFDGQLAAARMLLDRVLPATQNVKVDGEVRHRVIPDDVTPEQAQRDYLEMVRGSTKALN